MQIQPEAVLRTQDLQGKLKLPLGEGITAPPITAPRSLAACLCIPEDPSSITVQGSHSFVQSWLQLPMFQMEAGGLSVGFKSTGSPY